MTHKEGEQRMGTPFRLMDREMRGRLDASLVNRVPGLMTPGTVYERIIREAHQMKEDTSNPGVVDFTLATDIDSLRIRLLHRKRNEFSGTAPLSYIVQTEVRILRSPSFYAYFGGNIGGGGYFEDQSTDLFIAGLGIKGNRSTTQGLMIDHGRRVAQVKGMDGGRSLDPWSFKGVPGEIDLEGEGHFKLLDLRGLEDEESAKLAFLLAAGNGARPHVPIVLPKRLSVVG